MHRFITWFNFIKVRFKSKRFIIPFIFALTLLFFPKDAFALEIDNVKFFNNNQLVHTFTKQDLQGGYASVDPILVDAFHINYKDANLKNNYVYDFEANFNMSGNRLFNNVADFFVYASPFGSSANLLNSTDSWFLYSAAEVSPFYDGEYVVTSSFTSTTSSNDLRFQYDLGDELILSAFRLNSAKLTNDGQDVGDVISNQTQELLDNQNKNQQQTNERLDALIDEFKSCKISDNLFKLWSLGGVSSANGLETSTDARLRTSDFIKVTNDYYYFTIANPNYEFVNVYMYDEYKNYLGFLSDIDSSLVPSTNFNYKFSFNVKYIRVVFKKIDNSSMTLGDVSNAQPKMQRGKDGVYCTNKIDATNEKLDDLNDSLNDDNVGGATSTGNDFFDNFNSKDNGGISRIVTMPLTLINGLISGGTCSNLEFEVLDKEVYFPSGCILWQNAPSTIVTIYRTIICGLFSYILATHLFKDIEDLKNPNKEEVSTLDL